MPSIRKHSRLLLVAVSCAAVGGGASVIAGAGAATTPAKHAASTAHRHAIRARGLRRMTARAVQGDLVVPTKTGFADVTFERGTVGSVSGQQLVMSEGTRKATYKTVTLTIPTSAVVRDDRQKSSLSDLKAGQRVVVLTGPKRTLVVARTPRAG